MSFVKVTSGAAMYLSESMMKVDDSIRKNPAVVKVIMLALFLITGSALCWAYRSNSGSNRKISADPPISLKPSGDLTKQIEQLKDGIESLARLNNELERVFTLIHRQDVKAIEERDAKIREYEGVVVEVSRLLQGEISSMEKLLLLEELQQKIAAGKEVDRDALPAELVSIVKRMELLQQRELKAKEEVAELERGLEKMEQELKGVL